MTEAAQRKLLTLLFADLSGYTELAHHHDPEYVDAVVGPLMSQLAALAAEHGAEVRPPQGDGFLAVFGAVTTRDDDPRRAVHAAQAMRRHVEALAADGRRTLGLHIGVASGEVLVRGDPGELSLTGTAVNLAARLNDQASRGEILVDETCAGLCREPEWFDEPRTFTLQGFPEAVRARLLVSTDSGTSPSAARAPVGRDAELSALDAAWATVVSSGVGRVVAVTGEAGSGKSTVVAAWRAQHVASRVLRGECRGYGHPLPLGGLLQALLSLGNGDLDAMVEHLAGSRAAPLARDLRAFLEATPLTAQRPREETGSLLSLVRRLLVEVAREAPLVVLLEDVHGAGSDLTEALSELVNDPVPAPVLFLVTSRGVPPAHERLALRPLDRSATRRLIAQHLGTEPEDHLVVDLHVRSAGNPLWLRESLALLRADGAALPTVPDSLRLIVTARFDALSAPGRNLLLRASVPPDECATSWLTGQVDAPELDALLEHGFLRAASDGHVAYSHEVVREVAYASLPKGKRVPNSVSSESTRLHSQSWVR